MTTSNQKTARDIMTRNVITLKERDTVKKAILCLVEHTISGAPVVDERTGKLVGLVSEYDLILAIQSVGAGLDVKDAMKRNITTVTENTPVDVIEDLMLTHKFRRLPVLNDEGKPIGIISRREVLKALYAES